LAGPATALAADKATSPAGSKPVAASPAPAAAAEGVLTSIASITKSLTNHEVTVQATVSAVREPRNERAPYTVTLTEGDASLPLVYWSDMQPQLGPKVNTGNVIRAKVTVSVYRDKLQLRIYDPNALNVVGVAPTATVIGKINADSVDHAVIITGTISGSEATDKGRLVKVQDATGEIPVVLEGKVLSGLVVADLVPGRAVTVTGPVKLREGKPAVVPEAASAVKLKPE
jgi:DNA/RNA endonuclease YhcR with UshA esterase domain